MLAQGNLSLGAYPRRRGVRRRGNCDWRGRWMKGRNVDQCTDAEVHRSADGVPLINGWRNRTGRILGVQDAGKGSA